MPQEIKQQNYFVKMDLVKDKRILTGLALILAGGIGIFIYSKND